MPNATTEAAGTAQKIEGMFITVCKFMDWSNTNLRKNRAFCSRFLHFLFRKIASKYRFETSAPPIHAKIRPNAPEHVPNMPERNRTNRPNRPAALPRPGTNSSAPVRTGPEPPQPGTIYPARNRALPAPESARTGPSPTEPERAKDGSARRGRGRSCARARQGRRNDR